MRPFRYLLEALVLVLGIALFRLLPIDAASWLGGRIACAVGPHHRAHRIARHNLELALPELSETGRQAILHGMWDNLGRVVAEYPHLTRSAMARRIRITGGEHIDAIKASGRGAVFISGHIGNWEIAPCAAQMLGLALLLIYRRLNNPYANHLLNRLRLGYNAAHIPKGQSAARASLRTLKAGQAVAMLVDQKMNEGLAIPFFGHTAMTAPFAAKLALRHGVPLLPAYVRRTGGAYFHVILLPPMVLERSSDRACDVENAMRQINALLETWIREAPEQWFWVHNRWPKASGRERAVAPH